MPYLLIDLFIIDLEFGLKRRIAIICYYYYYMFIRQQLFSIK
jgi:hypothetical protein